MHPTQTFAQAVNTWVDFRSRSWSSPRSRHQYGLWVPRWIRVMGDIPIESVTPLTIQSLYLKRDDGKRSSVSVNKERELLHAFFSWAIGLGLLVTNPVTRSSWPVVPRRKSPRSRKELELDPLVVERLLWLLPVSLRRIIPFLWVVGLRISEGLAAVWEWVRQDERDPESWILQVPDTRKQRTSYIVPLGVAACRILGRRGLPNEKLFPEAPSSSRIRYAMRRAGLQLGIDGLSPHQLRKGCATMLANSGMALPAVQRYLGWSSPPKEWLKMFQESYYRGLESSRMREISDKLWPS